MANNRESGKPLRHVPVLLEEAVQALAVQPGGRYVDGTVGSGGHAAAILERSSPGGQLLGIDADPQAIAVTRQRLEEYWTSLLLVCDHFANLKDICLRHDFLPVHGILLDLGLSSLQLEDGQRGFSFQRDAPLDMRHSPDQEITAADIINTYSETELESLIREYGEETHSRQIARRVVAERPINTTVELARLIETVVGLRHGRIHPATRTFQALRMAVNRELEQLKEVLKQAVEILGFEGRLVVISYHSLEDRVVKQFMQREATACVCPPEVMECVCHHQATLRMLSRKVLKPSPLEVQRNPRSRSARLRVAERITAVDDTFADYLNILAGNGSRAWRKPVLVEKLRRTFLALEVTNLRT
jgi:16S rRNA (cytosine1402-N4)-methyltransferase